jgi:DNA-binding transcriptional LysR family regulator
MELRQLEYFVAVARTGTYLAAAASLSVAQPALWRQVKDLERELGTPLFERVGRRVRLTRDGDTLAELAATVLAGATRLRDTASDLRTGRTGAITIACAAPHLREFLAPVIAAMRTDHPDVRIDVVEYGGGAAPAGRGILSDLLQGLADLATGLGPGDDRIESVALYEVGLLLAVPDGDPLRDARLVDVGQLRERPLVTAQVGSYSRAALEVACARAGFAPTIGFDSPNPLSILALGQAGLGLPVLVEDAVPQPLGRPWPRLAERGRPISQTMRLGWRAGAPVSTAAKAFIGLAEAEAARRRSAAS